MKYVLCSVRKKAIQTTWCRNVKFAHSRYIKLWKSDTNPNWNFRNSLNMYCRRRWGQSTAWKIQTIEQGRGRNGEEEGWWKNVCVSTRSRTRHPLYDDQWIGHYLKTPSWIQNSNQYPRFHVPSLFPHYCTHKLCKAKLLHKILFEDK